MASPAASLQDHVAVSAAFVPHAAAEAAVNYAPAAPAALPREMQRHAYSIMYAVEQTHWWFVGRRRIISSFLRRKVADLGLGRRARLLDVGCGTGANLLAFRQIGEADGVDISEDALAFCRSRGLDSVRRGAAESLPYEDECFDLVTAIDVVEHLDDDLACLREMRRVLRPGGAAVLFVPAFMFLWSAKDEVVRHRRRYRLPEFTRVVREAGFEVERATYANLIFFLPVLMGHLLMRLFKLDSVSDEELSTPLVNRVCGKLFGMERHLLHRARLPFGVSILCVARRPAEEVDAG